jgi:hypothetical protein
MDDMTPPRIKTIVQFEALEALDISSWAPSSALRKYLARKSGKIRKKS